MGTPLVKNTISYWNRAWRSGTRYRDEEVPGEVLDPQPEKPKFRTGHLIEFSWTAGSKKQGKVWQVQRDTKTGETWYSVKVEGDARGAGTHHVPEEDVLRRIEE